MTSKQRVQKTFLHEKTDMVPINYFANSAIDAKLKAHFGLTADDDEGLRLALGVDFRCIMEKSQGVLHKPDAIDVENGYQVHPQWGIRTRWVEHATGGYQDYMRFPLKGASLDDMKKWPFPDPAVYDYSDIKRQTEIYKDYALYVGGGGLGDNMNHAGMLFSQEDVYSVFNFIPHFRKRFINNN